MKNITVFFYVMLGLLIMLSGIYIALLYSEAAEAVESGHPENSPLPVKYHVWATCPSCSDNVLESDDCESFLEQIRDHPDFLKAAASVGFDITRMNRIEKKLELNVLTSQKEIKCYYYSPA